MASPFCAKFLWWAWRTIESPINILRMNEACPCKHSSDTERHFMLERMSWSSLSFSCFITGRFRVQISVRRRVSLTRVLCFFLVPPIYSGGNVLDEYWFLLHLFLFTINWRPYLWTHIYLVSKMRISGVIYLRPQYALMLRKKKLHTFWSPLSIIIYHPLKASVNGI